MCMRVRRRCGRREGSRAGEGGARARVPASMGWFRHCSGSGCVPISGVRVRRLQPDDPRWLRERVRAADRTSFGAAHGGLRGEGGERRRGADREPPEPELSTVQGNARYLPGRGRGPVTIFQF